MHGLWQSQEMGISKIKSFPNYREPFLPGTPQHSINLNWNPVYRAAFNAATPVINWIKCSQINSWKPIFIFVYLYYKTSHKTALQFSLPEQLSELDYAMVYPSVTPNHLVSPVIVYSRNTPEPRIIRELSWMRGGGAFYRTGCAAFLQEYLTCIWHSWKSIPPAQTPSCALAPKTRTTVSSLKGSEDNPRPAWTSQWRRHFLSKTGARDGCTLGYSQVREWRRTTWSHGSEKPWPFMEKQQVFWSVKGGWKSYTSEDRNEGSPWSWL